MRCASCGAENPPRFKFCGECGHPLTGQPAASPSTQRDEEIAQTVPVDSPSTLRRTPEAERRQLTVMFCDLVGSTPLAEQLDPEDLREVILAYQQVCAEQIRSFEGYLARYVGDGLLVYFGYPQAHEDDAQRAIRAGLGIVAALPHLNTQLQQTAEILQELPLQVRIGIHTGLVVVGDMGGGDYRDPMAIVGQTPNIAARLQGIAEPNTVVISAATARLVQGLFECQDHGPQALKGVSTPVPVYRVLQESAAQGRFEVAVTTGLLPLVGREHELGLLRERWEQVKGGQGQVLLLSGEPGIGKSRLVQELKEQVARGGATRIEFRCSPYHSHSALYPIIARLQRLLQFAPHDPPPAKLGKLQQTLAHYRFPRADTLSLLAALLSLPHPEGAPSLTLSPQKQKEKTQDALVAWMMEEAEHAAVFCVWEDLQWADPSTLELLTLLLEQVPTTRLLALLTFRPEFIPSWRPHSHLTQLTLNRLGRHPVEAMVENITGGKALPRAVVQQIVAKTDGVPLFVEELTKMVLESSLLTAADDHYELTGPLPPLAIPSTLQDSLVARLDRLATGKEVAQVGATLGREFSYEVLQAVSPVDERSLQQALAKLVEAEVLYQRGLPPQARYLFKHALIQDTAYQSLLKSTRQHLHHQIAHMLEERFAETTEAQPELLAYHYTEAGLVRQAIPYWQKAGQKATQHSAHVEAISHLTQGLELLKTLPDAPERAQQELTLQITLGASLLAAKGFAAPEVGTVYRRARELCQQVGETSQLFRVLRGLCSFYGQRAELQAAREVGEQLLSVAQREQDPALLVEAHRALGQVLGNLGEFRPAQAHLDEVIGLYDPQRYRSHAFLYGADPGVTGLSNAAWTLWHLGYPDQALRRIHEGLSLAQALAHPFSLAYALAYAVWLHQFRREEQLSQERAETLMALSHEHGFPEWLAWGTILRGRALAEQSDCTPHTEITEMHKGLAAYLATGAESWRVYLLALLAEAYGKRGQAEEGLAVLTEALAVVDKSEACSYESELHRLKGELTLQSHVASHQSKVEEAEACFLKAIAIARRQSAKSWELRAVMSLSRLWQHQGKKDEAQQMLAEIYGWFTEGFDTKDLQEAKTLLEELT
jgi:class 3 adenylate cyclase/tetratricopeptide (TPR) repeat protein